LKEKERKRKKKRKKEKKKIFVAWTVKWTLSGPLEFGYPRPAKSIELG
jgi:hypothetical protein